MMKLMVTGVENLGPITLIPCEHLFSLQTFVIMMKLLDKVHIFLKDL